MINCLRRAAALSSGERNMDLSDIRTLFEPGDHSRSMLFGRNQDLEWLFDRFERGGDPAVLTGNGGMGKTALLRQFIGSVRTRHPPLLWTPRSRPGEAMNEILARIDDLRRNRDVPEIIAIDDADAFQSGELNVIAERLLNFKAVRMLVFAGRYVPELYRAKKLQLEPLREEDAVDLLRALLGDALPMTIISNVVNQAGGLPLALHLLANQIRGRAPEEIERLLSGNIYRLDQQIIIPERTLITEVKPRIMTVNEALVERLRSRPQAMLDLPPRKFEELIAELLDDLGYEVQLTPATRDGGKDILAYMTTPHGRLLCLVEAKRYRRRPIGVELVRQLYGTLADSDATSAMLVTTSSFRSGARDFQKRHPYRLELRDYDNIVEWIEGYRGR